MRYLNDVRIRQNNKREIHKGISHHAFCKQSSTSVATATRIFKVHSMSNLPEF